MEHVVDQRAAVQRHLMGRRYGESKQVAIGSICCLWDVADYFDRNYAGYVGDPVRARAYVNKRTDTGIGTYRNGSRMVVTQHNLGSRQGGWDATGGIRRWNR